MLKHTINRFLLVMPSVHILAPYVSEYLFPTASGLVQLWPLLYKSQVGTAILGTHEYPVK